MIFNVLSFNLLRLLGLKRQLFQIQRTKMTWILQMVEVKPCEIIKSLHVVISLLTTWWQYITRYLMWQCLVWGTIKWTSSGRKWYFRTLTASQEDPMWSEVDVERLSSRSASFFMPVLKLYIEHYDFFNHIFISGQVFKVWYLKIYEIKKLCWHFLLCSLKSCSTTLVSWLDLSTITLVTIWLMFHFILKLIRLSFNLTLFFSAVYQWTSSSL